MTQSQVSFTSQLLSYIEPYYIDGIAKVAFYSEVNTNIQKNDKVFITNGYFDSEYYVNKGKWVKNADGYRVLYVDRCKIVLDINYDSGIYSGITQSYQIGEYDNFIKVHNIRSQREFDYINKLQVDTYSSGRISKFGGTVSTNALISTNNIIYSKDIYTGTLDGLGENNGLTYTESFWVKNKYAWLDITNFFLNANFQFSSDYIANGLTSNGRILIMGGDIDYNGITLKERSIYKFNNDTNIFNWEFDTIYKQPIISKLNFKKGIFRGIHNDGIFGSYKKVENWDGSNSDVKWNGGFLVNAKWTGGDMKSKSDSLIDASYYTTISNGKPVQNTDFSNNKGFGYNYIVDSSIIGQYTNIYNGNFINCNIGLTAKSNPVGNYMDNNIDGLFSLNIRGGLYSYCNIRNSQFYNSTTLDSTADNSLFHNSKNINSQLHNCVVEYGEFSSSKGISVISADIYSFLPSVVSSTYSTIRGGIKLEISEEDYLRLDNLDKFYITKVNKNYILNNLSDDDKIILPYETLYILDTFFDFKVASTNQDCFATIKSGYENKYLVEVSFDGAVYGNTFSAGNSKPSIDIDLGSYMSFYKNALGDYTYLNQNQNIIITKDSVKTLFPNTKITNSDISDGIFTNSTWNSGASVNYPSNIIKCLSNGTLDIEKSSTMIGLTATGTLEIKLNEAFDTINDDHLAVGTYLWIDSISVFNTTGTHSLSGAYLILKVVYQPSQVLITITSDIIQSNPTWFTSNNTFFTEGNPNYASINKLLIDSSTINSGLFKRTLMRNSNFTNNLFNNKDTSISNDNIDQLRIVNSIFKDNKNTINSGLFHKSHFIQSDWVWNSGIIDNSIWINQTFNDGIFNRSSWINGIFNNGYFQNSNNNLLSPVDYSNDSQYKNWFNGTFNTGSFYNSTWLNGIFNGGKFYNSEWHGGFWNNGILGDKTIPTLNTLMGKISSLIGATQTFWKNGIVDNAQIGGDGVIYWYDGKFNDGVFTSNTIDNSTWYNGDFNGGNFTGLSKWKNGIFNNGKFTSWYGWTLSSTQSTDFGWEKGVFNNGQFGNASYATNSVWFDGEFNGGIFQGRVWNNGIFLNGTFNGGSTWSFSQEESFVESFTQSYYGLWVNGWVTNIRDLAITDQLIPYSNTRVTETSPSKIVNMNNILWLNGNFNHTTGKMENSIFLAGTFSNGNFNNSSFNPYVNRSLFDISYSNQKTFELNNCVWVNGRFDGGNFYISEWQNGTFKSGIMSGGIWRDGIWEYGFAKNIYWENGIWKNGTWDGSPFDRSVLGPTNSVKSGMESDIILNVSNALNVPGSVAPVKVHLNNAFSATQSDQLLYAPKPVDFSGWSFTDTSRFLTDWSTISTISGTAIGLSNQRLGTPSFTTLQTDIDFTTSYPYVFTVGYSVSPGDTYIVYATGSAGLTFSKYTAVLGDTYKSVISALISQMYPIVSGPYPLVDVYNGNSGIYSYGQSTTGNYFIGSAPLYDGYQLNPKSSTSRLIGGLTFSSCFLEPSQPLYSTGKLYYSASPEPNLQSIVNASYIVNYNCNFSITPLTASNYQFIVSRIGGIGGSIVVASHSFYASETKAIGLTGTTNVGYGGFLSGYPKFYFEVRSLLTGTTYSFTIDSAEVSMTNLGYSAPTLQDNQFIIRIASSSIGSTYSSGPATLPYLNSEVIYPMVPGTNDFSIISDNNTVVGGSSSTPWSSTPIIYYQFNYTLTSLVSNNDFYKLELSGSKSATATYSVPSTGTYSTSTVYTELATGLNRNIGLSASVVTGGVSGSYLQLMILYSLGDSYKLKASQNSSTKDIFTKSNAFYLFDINVTSLSGRTDFVVHLGDDSYTRDVNGNQLSLTSNTATYSFIKTITDNISSSSKIGIERALYTNPDNSQFIINSASLYEINPVYSSEYNNTLYQFATYSLTPFVYGTATSISLPSSIFTYASVENQIVSLKFGNGVFRSGIWEAGIWNNGWRSIWIDSDVDYIIFTDISSVTEISINLWSIKLDAAYDVSQILSVSDNVSIGNIICIDINEHRRFIKDYYKVTNISSNGLSVTVEISLNMPVRRIVRDSDNHFIYMTKNIWLGGVFHNGYFKGVWNYGLFKGYPYITKISDSHFIDGVFDGGRYTSSKYIDPSTGTELASTGVIQNFLFRDNNVYPTANKFLFNSWIDVNYFTYSMTNLFRDNIRYDYDHGVVVSDGNLRGYPTLDVLSSDSVFRNSYDSYSKYYKLGSKYTIYNDFIGDSSYFNYPINTNAFPGNNTPGDAEFLANNWLYNNTSTTYTANTKPEYDDEQLTISYTAEQFPKTGIRAVQTDTLQYQSFVERCSRRNDFSTLPSSGGYEFRINSALINKKFSNFSLTASSWKYYTISDLTNDINNNQYKGLDYGATLVADRQVYVLDWLRFGSLSASNDGYNVGGGSTNNYMAVTQSSNNGGEDFTFYAYECKNTTTFTVNAYIPFTFYGDETYHNYYVDWGGFHEGTYRGGGSMFKLVGVVEKCSTLGLSGSALYATLGADDNWKYVTHTKLGTFKTSEGDDTGDGFSLNKDLCNIGYDNNPTLIANLYINNVSISVSEGDYIRLRLYWIDVQKSFSSTDRNENDTAAPGSIRIKIGVDPVMKYTKSNQGYFELVDNSVYYKENLNVLENSLTRDIEKFRYSIVDFDLNGFDGEQNSGITDIPTIYLLNDNYSPNLPGKSSVVNHTLSNGNKKEYFYNRNSLELFFESSSTFIAKFGKISFYETDMIPFFRYTTEDSVNKNIKIPLYATASIIPNRGNVTFDSKVEKAIDFNIDYRNLSTIHTPPTTTTTSTTTTTTTVGPMYLLDASFTGNTHITTPQNPSSWFFQPTWSYGYSKFAFTSCTASGFTYSSSKNDFRYTPSGAMKGKWIIEVTGVNNALDFFSPCHVRLNSSGGTFYDQVVFHGPFTISKVITNKVYNNRVFWLEVISSNANITSARLRFLIND